MKTKKTPFVAFYESGTVVEFYYPQTWRNIHKYFKHYGRFEGYGKLYYNGQLIKTTGKRI